jgi:hypothetical protein
MSANNMTIVDRVVERLKVSPIGDLITEEDLFEIVKQAIPKVFFEKRLIRDNSYSTPRELPPLIFEVMAKVLEPHVSAAVDKWAAENQDKILEFWIKASEDGLLKTAQHLTDARAAQTVRTVLQPMVEQWNREQQARGGPQLFI